MLEALIQATLSGIALILHHILLSVAFDLASAPSRL
jgi:hypothetical protein